MTSFDDLAARFVKVRKSLDSPHIEDIMSDVNIEYFLLKMLGRYIEGDNITESACDVVMNAHVIPFLKVFDYGPDEKLYGLEKEVILSKKGRRISKSSGENIVRKLNRNAPEGVEFSLDGNQKIGVIEYKSKGLQPTFIDAMNGIKIGEEHLIRFIVDNDYYIKESCSIWASNIHIHYGLKTFEERYKRFIAVRDLLPELLLIVGRNGNKRVRSYRLHKRFSNYIINYNMDNLLELYNASKKFVDNSRFVGMNLMRFSDFGTIEFRLIDALPIITDQSNELYVVNSIIEMTEEIYNNPSWHAEEYDNLKRRWEYAMKNREDYFTMFPERAELFYHVLDIINFNTDDIRKRLNL